MIDHSKSASMRLWMCRSSYWGWWWL